MKETGRAGLCPAPARDRVPGPDSILSTTNLTITFKAGPRTVTVVDDVDIQVSKGKTLGIVGESGCGKSMLSLSLMRLVPPPGKIQSGKILFDKQDLTTLPDHELKKLRGARIATIFQDPLTSLNPVYTIGHQITEAIRAHDRTATRKTRRTRTLDALAAVHITDPARRIDEYPHQLSGGMRQRVMIAMAIACEPTLLIADEPTTALDVTVQAQILDLLRELQQRTGMAMILITHDLGVIAQTADDIAVMYAGRIVEYAPTTQIFDSPQHPYTLGLLGSIPRLDDTKTRLLAIEGAVPSAFAKPKGCRFHPRCVFADHACTVEDQTLHEITKNHLAACRLAPVEQAHA